MALKQATMTCALALIASCSAFKSPITAEQYNQIQERMTYREVAEIMGGPGDHSVNEAAEEYSEYLVGPESMGKVYLWGIPDECLIMVHFKDDSDGDDGNDRVDMKGHHPEGCL